MGNNKINQIVQLLKKQDLALYPLEDVLSLFRTIGSFPIIVTTLHPGRIIVRGQNYDSTADYTIPSRHSYKPEKLNTTYQRASTPLQTMFYGSITDEDIEKTAIDDNIPLARHIIMTEIGKTVKEDADKETVVFSSWVVLEDINLVSVIQSDAYKTPSKSIRNLQRDFKTKFGNLPEMDFINFVASEFSKEDASSEEDYKYLISAWFSKVCCDLGYDGVAYPSVRAGGSGLNVAIKPEAVDKKMKLIRADEVDIVREDMSVSEVARRNIIEDKS
jgi:hypothetical protein